MKAVLRSIEPYFLYLVLTRQKNIEIAKEKPTRPDWNHDIYLYCKQDTVSLSKVPKEHQALIKMFFGKVACKFDCDEIIEFYSNDKPDYELDFVMNDETIHKISIDNFSASHNFIFFEEESGMTKAEIRDYIGDKKGYGYHISQLEVFGEPKELSAFKRVCNGDCYNCKYAIWKTDNCSDESKVFGCQEIPAPQSWCYVEGFIEDTEEV